MTVSKRFTTASNIVQGSIQRLLARRYVFRYLIIFLGDRQTAVSFFGIAYSNSVSNSLIMIRAKTSSLFLQIKNRSPLAVVLRFHQKQSYLLDGSAETILFLAYWICHFVEVVCDTCKFVKKNLKSKV